MDAAPREAQALGAALSLGGNTAPHKVAEALLVLLLTLPLDVRARVACVCRAWRAAAAHPLLWEELSFDGCRALVGNATLASLCARAGAALRTLSLEVEACSRVTAAGVLAALRDGGCTGLLRLNGPCTQNPAAEHLLTPETAQLLAAACPKLQRTACAVRCGNTDASAVLAALPGLVTLVCEKADDDDDTDVTQLAECLRVNATLTSLDLSHMDMWQNIGDVGATQLAECLRINATLTSLKLGSNGIGDEGAAQLAECLRANATLTSLNLSSNKIDDKGATQLAKSLRVNATLTSLSLSENNIGAEGATQLAESLRVNATLTSLDLRYTYIGDEGATRLAECLRVNATLTSLYLS